MRPPSELSIAILLKMFKRIIKLEIIATLSKIKELHNESFVNSLTPKRYRIKYFPEAYIKCAPLQMILTDK